MRLSIRLFASLRERAGRDELVLEGLPDALDVAALKREVARRHPELGALEAVRAVVGDAWVGDGRRLASGDDVALLPPVSGGSGADDALAQGVFELCGAPLDPARALARVASDACGANALFAGTTRGEHRGRRVLRLEYEAFERMTAPEMARIFARCRSEHGDAAGHAPERALRMLCQHRVGSVGVGEPSVVIAVASPHRAAAFAACRFLIDELKRSMPIWKKEIYSDGAHWVNDRS